MANNRKLSFYEDALLKKFKDNFYDNFVEIFQGKRFKNIQEIFLGSLCRLFDAEMAFIAVGETRKSLNIKYIYPGKSLIKEKILSLKEESGTYDDLEKANVGGLFLLVNEGINSVLFIPIEVENSKIQYLFLCNRKVPAIFNRLFTTYDLNFCKILVKYILPWLLLFSLREKDRRLFRGRFKRELKTIIIRIENRYTNESTFKEDDISNELQEEDRYEIKALLKEAEDKIDMWYMRIVSLINGETFGYEMLARDITKVVPVFPKDIFERAKTLGADALTQLDCLCIRKVFDKLKKDGYLIGKFICINIYPDTIFDHSFEKIIKEISQETPPLIPPWFIVFEIVETGLITDYERFKERIAELLSYNIRFAVDDHGEGAATDQRLLALLPNFVKISGEFIDKLLTDDAVKEILVGLVKATHKFRGFVIAETIRKGEQTDKLINTLKKVGITFGQGFHFGEAVREISTKTSIKSKDSSDAKVKRSLIPTIPPYAKRAYNFNSLDTRVKCQIQEIGECKFWNLLKRLLPRAEGTVSYMQPGRSGAYVFKILAKFRKKDKSKTLAKAWIIKLATKKELLELEVEKYNELIMTPLNRAFYPKLLTSKPKIFANLAGIAIELEEDASSLMESFYKLSEKEINIITDNIVGILKSMYGDPDKRIHMLWKDFYNLNEIGWTRILSFFEENENTIKEKLSDSERIQNFVRTRGESEKIIINFQIDADTRTVHGDFNSRNILVNKNNKVIVIDFSAMGQSHIAKDIAKLERDVIFRIFDTSSPYYHDWSRIKIWQHFSNLNKKGNIFPQKIYYSGNNMELKKSIAFICAIRNILKQLSPELDEREYLCALLHFSLLALIHPEISIQKKVFAVQYINKILENFS